MIQTDVSQDRGQTNRSIKMLMMRMQEVFTRLVVEEGVFSNEPFLVNGESNKQKL